MSNNVRRVSDSYRTFLIHQYLSVYVKQCQTMSDSYRTILIHLSVYVKQCQTMSEECQTMSEECQTMSDSYKQNKIILLRLYKRVKQNVYTK